MKKFPEIDSGIRLGGQPTEDEMAGLRQLGVNTIIDFRKPAEQELSNRALAERQGLAYVNLPVDRESPSAETVAELDVVLREHTGPFLLHCGSGIRAVTMYLARQAQDQGWPLEKAMAEARRRGFDLEAAPDLGGFLQQFLKRRRQN